MTREEKYAFDAAKEILVARMSNTSIPLNSDSAYGVADFFEVVYDRLKAISERTKDD